MDHPCLVVLFATTALVASACGSDDEGAIDLSGPAEVITDAGGTAGESTGDLPGERVGDGDLLDGMVESISTGTGTGTVTVAGVTYTVDADLCFAQPDDFTIDGAATGSDGSVAWVSVEYSLTTREEMLEYFDESTVDAVFPDGAEALEDASVAVNVGQTSRLGSVDDQPAWSAYSGTGFGAGELIVELSGNTMTGRGEASDVNDVALDSAAVPIEFDVRCG